MTKPLYMRLRAARTAAASRRWDIASGIQPKEIQIGVGQTTNVLIGLRVASVTVDEPGFLTAGPDAASGGVRITGFRAGGTAVTATFPDGATESWLVLVVAEPGGTGGGSWTAWSESYAGNWGDQRRYHQVENDPDLCPNAYSGCGPTAWAMLYGWWDRKGVPRALADPALADSPQLNTSASVLDCYYYVFPRVGTFCVQGQGATTPWDMKNGYKWAAHRGMGVSIAWRWGLPYLSPGSRDNARNSVKAGHPAIIGIGFYWHYVVAYGYRYREWRSLGIVWDREHHFKCNMGWGGPEPEWRNGDSIWFSTNGGFSN